MCNKLTSHITLALVMYISLSNTTLASSPKKSNTPVQVPIVTLNELVEEVAKALLTDPFVSAIRDGLLPTVIAEVRKANEKLSASRSSSTALTMAEIYTEIATVTKITSDLKKADANTRNLITDLQQQLKSHKQATATHQRQVDLQIATLKKVDAKLLELFDTLQGTDIESIKQLINDIASFTSRLAETEGSIAELSSRISHLEVKIVQDIENVAQKLATLQGEQDALAIRFNDIAEQVRQYHNKTAELESKIADLEKRVDAKDIKNSPKDSQSSQGEPRSPTIINIYNFPNPNSSTEPPTGDPGQNQPPPHEEIRQPPPNEKASPVACNSCSKECRLCLHEACTEFTEDCQDRMRDECAECSDCIKDECKGGSRSWQLLQLVAKKQWLPLSQFRGSIQANGAICRGCSDECRKCRDATSCESSQDEDCFDDLYSECEDCMECLEENC